MSGPLFGGQPGTSIQEPTNIVDADGDLIVGTGDNTISRLGLQTIPDGYVLTKRGTAPHRIAWEPPPAGTGGGGGGDPDPDPENDPVTLGVTVPGTDIDFPTSGNHSTVIRRVAPYDCKVTKLRAWLRNNGVGGPGAQGFRPVVYQESGGLATAPLVQSGATQVLTSDGTTGVTLVEWDLGAPLQAISGGSTIEFGIHARLGPGPNQCWSIMGGTAVADTTYQNNDNFDDGAANPFGAITAGYAWEAAFQIVVEPMDSSSVLIVQEDGTILGTAAAVNAGAGIVGSLASGVFTISTVTEETPDLAVFPPTLLEGARLVSDPTSPGGVAWQPDAPPTSGNFWQTDYDGLLVYSGVSGTVATEPIDTKSDDFYGPQTFGEFVVSYQSDAGTGETIEIYGSSDGISYNSEEIFSSPGVAAGPADAYRLATVRWMPVQRYVFALVTGPGVNANVKVRSGYLWGVSS